jgi:hypothetical protein
MVRTATGASAFETQVEQALEFDRTPDSARARAEYGFSCTWEDRAEDATRLVSDLLARGRERGGRS